jgi:hypothetical protein
MNASGTEKETQGTEPMSTTRPPLDSTAVTSWLRARYAGGFAEAFYQEGYFDVDEVEVAAVDRIVTEKGTASRLKADLERRARGAMVPPDLPAGTTLDLSKPEVTSADGVTFTVPTSLSVERTQDAIQSPNALQNGDWVVIARNSALLYGFRMDGPAPARARRPVLEWVVPERIDFARSEMYQARVESTVTYTEETAAYVRSGFDKQSATAGFPFCSASFERSHKERTARASARKELHQIGMWKYPRATLFLDECTRVSQAFVQAIRDALDAIDPREALRLVLLDYGHAVPVEVTLGGQLHFKHVRTEDSTTSEKQVEQEIRAAVEVKYQGFSGSAGFAKGTATSHSEASVALAEQTSFDGLGGDATLVSNPSGWAPTVKDPRLWAVIGNTGLCSPIDLLEPALRAEVLRHWPPPQYLELPAIEEPLEVPVNTAARATTAGFLLGLRDCIVDSKHGQRGSVFLASGRQDRDPMQDQDFCGEANVHAYRPHDVWFDVNSVCLPVAAGSGYGVWTEDTKARAGPPRSRLGFARTRFDFGSWRSFAVGNPQTVVEDGFLAVSVTAPDRGYGQVEVIADEVLVAATAVHYDPLTVVALYPAEIDATIRRAVACVPVRAGSTVAVRGAAQAQARWIPLAADWTMGSARAIAPNTHLTAETDGILHGLLDAEGYGARAFLRLYSGAPDPWAGASAHNYPRSGYPHPRHVRYASAMLPVGKGTTYFASYTPTCNTPRLTLTWTPITRRT